MCNNNHDEIGKILDEVISNFLTCINKISENSYFRSRRLLVSAFEIFDTANDEFYEYAYFERTLEWYIREYLLNEYLFNLFEFYNIDCLWPDKKLEAGFSNEQIEDKYPFEFIVIEGNEKIGYRYTGLCENEITDLLNLYSLTKIVVINFKKKHNKDRVLNSNYHVIEFSEFLEKYFSNINYEDVLNKMKNAVKIANDDIGFKTIPNLSVRNLSNFKNEISKWFSTNNFRTMKFQTLNNDNKNLNLSYLSNEDYNICDYNFITNELYKTVISSEGFAKCFITAEYQYQIFKQGHNFDYTSVACGYLKSIEQLIYKLININLIYPSNDTLWIKQNSLKLPKTKNIKDVYWRYNPITNKKQVLFDKEFAYCFDTTLAPMIWFLHDNINGWNISNASRILVKDFLIKFSQECRNDHFHKDNIENFSVVERIRNNTILLIYLLLGGYKLSGNIENDKLLLNIKDDSFERLYKKMQKFPTSVYKFIIKFEDKTIKAYKHFYQNKTIYDENGSVIKSNIRFVEVEEFSNNEYDKAMNGEYLDKEFCVSVDNMPLQISYINGKDDEVIIEW